MILQKIQTLLEAEGVECLLLSATKNLPFDHLKVMLELDDKKRERLLEIVALPQQAQAEAVSPQVFNLPDRIQFRVQLPFKVQDLALNQVASLLLFLNQLSDFPGFELDELEGGVAYRYVWISPSTLLDSPSLMSIVSAVMLNLRLFSDTIESLADGQTSFNDLLTQVTRLLDTSHPFDPLKKPSS